VLQHFSFFPGISSAGILVLVGLGISGAPARASDCAPCCEYKWIVTYECVITYETRTVPYTKTVTCYDECGRPYPVSKTCYREVQVAVKKVVPVKKKVLVSY
jgi:hypothetical protein